MLEIPTDDRTNGDVLGQAGYAGAQAADAADDEIDPRPRVGCGVQLVDHLRVDERVDLHHDLTVGPGLATDEVSQLVAQVHRRDHQSAVFAGPAVAGEVVEQLRQVGAEIGIAGKHAEVFVRRSGLRVVVAGAEVAVAADSVRLLANDQQDLGMGLEPDESVHDVCARLLEHPGPLDVRLLVEAGLQLDECDDLLSRLGRLDERYDDAGLVAAGAVQRLLDREHRVVARGLLDERLDRVRERVVRVVQQHVAASHRPEHVAVFSAREGRRVLGRECGVLQLGPSQVVEIPQPAQIERRVDLIDVVGAELELAAQQREHLGRDLRVDLEPNRETELRPLPQ